MEYFKIVIHIILFSSLLTSCELFQQENEKDTNVNGGEVVWKVENQTSILVGTQPLIENNTVFFVQDGKLKAYTLSTGKYLWSSPYGDNYSREIIGSKDKIFIDQGYDIRAVNKSNGALMWKTEITENGNEVSGIGSPILSQDEKYLFAGRKGYVLKLRKNDGQIVQRYPLDRLVPDGILQGSTEPIISPFGDNILYVPTSYFDHSKSIPEKASGGNIFAFNALTGKLIWEQHVTITVLNNYTEASKDSITGSPFIFDIAVTENKVIALPGNYVIALDRFTGKPLWKTYLPHSGFDVGLAVKGEGVYAASIGTFAHKLDLQTGEPIWRTDIKYSNTSIPTVKKQSSLFC